jgi:hypothetical protein
MEAVGDLDRRRGAAGRAFGKVRPPVAANYPDLRLQPGGKGVSLTVRQPVNDLVAFAIDQDRPIGPAATLTPIVAADHMTSRSSRQRRPSHLAHEGIRTAKKSQGTQEPRTSSATQREAHCAHPRIEPLGAPRVRSHYTGQALGEDAPRALRPVTEEATDMQLEAKGHGMPGDVGHRAHVARMHPAGEVSTDRTGHGRGSRRHHGRNPLIRRRQRTPS